MKRLAARLAAPALLALMTVALALPVPGCAGGWANVKNDLPAITADINQASLVVSTIETFVNGYLENHAASQDTVARVAAAFVKVKLAIAAVDSIGRGASDLTGDQAQAALAEFYSAYGDLVALVKSFGVTPASSSASGPRLAAAPGGLTVPAPADLALSKRRKA